MKKNQQRALEIILSGIALVVATLIFLKAFIDIDTNYDVGWYHLPFAARIWGIVPAESFSSENIVEYRYAGFPLLAHFFQGLLWKISGRVQAANLVGYLSLIIYFLTLRSFFQVPLYLSTIAIFAIPAVLTHASTSFVDLPGNVGAAVLMMMIYRFFSQSQLPSKPELLFAFLGAAMAANTKPQLEPLIFVLFWVAGIRLVWLYFKYTTSSKRQLWLTVSLAAIASILIFATPIKNVALYGNPFYPIKIQVAGIVLNHKLTPQTYSEGNRPQKWLQSILEINTPKWSADQYNGGDEKYLDRAGGFFGAYVVFNLLLLLGLTIREQLLNRTSADHKSRNATIALVTFLLVSFIPANFPQSHELRYFMFWMITLVSLNLSLVSGLQNQGRDWLQVKYLGLVYLLFMAIVWVKIDQFYLKPDFRTLERYLKNNVKAELVEQMIPNQRTCLIARHAIVRPNAVPFASIANAFFYSSYFHPEIPYNYSVKAAIAPQDCGKLTMIPANAADFIDP
ncbi:hypothetical protein C7B62_23305 [Pleurocapsa sp. CCALA 161]|uniref:hypothetical protein n=1 Tax=Pleurocapsa sp. CCALA 161 TaxID=2107688 RepID=UPI000D07B4AE|nr:hypothetical protein [Pleurocapsa sp. CCALA 161]PSB06270.1 hypothetical protein C7B62_23305 [Pleurocapsa sp. CCALA 161]